MTKKTNTTIYKPKGYNQLAKATRLPKKEFGGGSVNNYIDQEMFSPSPSPQYENLASYNKYTNEQEFGPGLSSDSVEGALSNQSTGESDINLGSNMLGSAAQIAASLVGDQSENPQYGNFDSVAADTMSNVGIIGQVAGAVGEVGGKLLKPDYDEYGVATSQSQEELYYQAGAYFDPLGAAEAQDSFGEGVLAALLPGWGGQQVQESENEDALKRRAIAIDSKNQARLEDINRGVVNYAKFGGKLPKKQTGGDLTPEQMIKSAGSGYKTFRNNPLYTEGDYTEYPTKKYATPIKGGAGTVPATIGSTAYNPAITGGYNITSDSIAGSVPLAGYVDFTEINGGQIQQTPMFSEETQKQYFPSTKRVEPVDPNVNFIKAFKNGGPINNIQSQTPIIRKYNGETHEGENEGVEVDAQGNPIAMTGNEPVALTEKGEVNYNGYIFSDSIKYKK